MFGRGASKSSWKSRGWVADALDCTQKASALASNLRTHGEDDIAMLVDIAAPSWGEPFYRAVEQQGGKLYQQVKANADVDGPHNAGIVAMVFFAGDQGVDAAAGILQHLMEMHEDPQAEDDLRSLKLLRSMVKIKESRDSRR